MSNCIWVLEYRLNLPGEKQYYFYKGFATRQTARRQQKLMNLSSYQVTKFRVVKYVREK